MSSQNQVPRYQKEYSSMQRSPLPGVSVSLVDNSIQHWNIAIPGPANSPYQGGIFRIDMEFPAQYPHEAPKVKFITKVYHPSVAEDGGICMPELSDKWAPSLTVAKIIGLISGLLASPSSEQQANPIISSLIAQDPEKFKQTAIQWTHDYAK